MDTNMVDADTMDMDIDIDLGVDEPIPASDEQQAANIDIAHGGTDFGMNSNAPTSQAVAAAYTADLPVPEAINIQGVDEFRPDDAKAYAKEHFNSSDFHRIVWVNDTSFNILYKTYEAAAAALRAYTSDEIIDPSSIPVENSRKAKPYSGKPEVELLVRQTNSGDVKRKDAHKYSRFYLLNPEFDPENERRENRNRSYGRLGGRGTDEDHSDYKVRRFDDREHDRRRNRDRADGFDNNMYDDSDRFSSTPNSVTEGRSPRRSRSSGRGRNRYDDDGYRGRFGGDSYRPKNSGNSRRTNGDLMDKINESHHGILRERSASPARDGDGRLGFDENGNPISHRGRGRSRSPNYRIRGNAAIRNNGRRNDPPRELIEHSNRNSALSSAHITNGGRSAFSSPTNGPRELLPNSPRELLSSTPSTNGKRELIGTSNGGRGLLGESSSASYSGTNGRQGFPHNTGLSNHRRTDATDESAHKRSLEDRITPKDGGPKKLSLEDRITPRDSDDMKIRGQAQGKNTEFKFLGQADLGTRIKGRGGSRKTAMDFD
ncbi:hypothetical protein GQ43DRAFT_433180 [Delitschia confertaspora ATCC 74209]|uniref:Uncharacterized protein n=1 Tax=Delitschia confertaspora ATCC 74209 TaxID=1513339 RepID=A0A9P4JM69_9PLEO|nr:hypothetical protein GQ43DRAFT_433180 [Delitschia confertaspora ATCC 74209]